MTPSLIGNSDAKVDAKGRAFLPATFRRLLGDEKVFYLRKGLFEDCLVLYPATAWESTISELREQLNPWVREEDMVYLCVCLLIQGKPFMEAMSSILPAELPFGFIGYRTGLYTYSH